MKEKIAVALKYPENCPAPFITAKGKGEVANLILGEAEKNNIEVVENTTLVEILSAEDIGNLIPENTWNAVAAIFAFMMSDD